MFNNQTHYGVMAQGFMTKVYGWMCAGLATTAAVMYALTLENNVGLINTLHSNFIVLIGLFAAMFGILIYMTRSFASLSYGAMAMLFLLFCGIQGIFLAPVLYVYTTESILFVFVITASMFAAMAIYGSVTNADLSSMSNILFMGLIGILIANLINMFVQSASFDMAIAVVAVGVFAMMIAYDVQNLKRISQMTIGSNQDAGKLALLGAVGLYLNVINIFIYLLRLFGDKRNK